MITPFNPIIIGLVELVSVLPRIGKCAMYVMLIVTARTYLSHLAL
jgi:hypothetical protein